MTGGKRKVLPYTTRMMWLSGCLILKQYYIKVTLTNYTFCRFMRIILSVSVHSTTDSTVVFQYNLDVSLSVKTATHLLLISTRATPDPGSCLLYWKKLWINQMDSRTLFVKWANQKKCSKLRHKINIKRKCKQKPDDACEQNLKVNRSERRGNRESKHALLKHTKANCCCWVW